jgi:hypothetical protein
VAYAERSLAAAADGEPMSQDLQMPPVLKPDMYHGNEH